MQEAWFYDCDSRTIYDENRLAVARDVGPKDARAILLAVGCEPEVSTHQSDAPHPLWKILDDMLAYEAERFDAEPLNFYVHRKNETWGPFDDRQTAENFATAYPGATISEEYGDLNVNGGDLVDAFSEWRQQLKAATRWPRPKAAVPVLQEAAALFREYEAHHKARADQASEIPEDEGGEALRDIALEKAERNATMAEKLESVLRGEPPVPVFYSPEEIVRRMKDSGLARTLYITLERGNISGIYSDVPMPDIRVTTIDYDTDGVERHECEVVSEGEGHLEAAYVRPDQKIEQLAAPRIMDASEERFDELWGA